MRFSANLGFLWADLPLTDGVRAAQQAGFDAVECHFPYALPPADLRRALDDTGLPMLGLNTAPGDPARGENGLAAVPGRDGAARDAIAQAVEYAAAIGARHVHVTAGRATGPAAHDTFLANLSHACDLAGQAGVGVLIEPLNRHDAPGYFLRGTDQARDIIQTLNHPGLKLMFDCYHVGRSEGDIVTRFTDLQPLIGHVQFAAVPDRGAPDHGEIDFAHVLPAIAAAGWTGAMGAEYRPAGDTAAGLGWLARFRALG